MDLTIILTGIGIVIAIVGTNIGLITWLRSDIQLNRSEAAADRRDMLQLMRTIQEEIKDFHGRLCAIEERNRGK